MKEPEVKSYKVGSYQHRWLSDHGSAGRRFTAGYITTAAGVVGVYMGDGVTMMVVVCNGREHRGIWRRTFTERGLVAAANRFSTRINEGN